MSPLAIVALLALTGYAIYRQSQRHEVTAQGRLKMAIIYAVAGLVVGGFSQPNGTAEWSLLIISIVLSVVVGLARGRFTRMWTEDRSDGRHVIAQGTVLTIGLFVAWSWPSSAWAPGPTSTTSATTAASARS